MKVCICTYWNKYNASETGKGKFAKRLAKALSELGVTIVDPSIEADIDLSFGRWHYKPYAKKNIIRLGAAHLDKDSDYKKLNKVKWVDVKHADAVVYQSQLSQQMCEKLIGKPKCPSTVIYNGADPMAHCSSPIINNHAKYSFLCCAREWTPNKRLPEIVEAFKIAAIPDSKLLVAGNVRDKQQANNVIYVGSVNDWAMGSLFKSCNLLLHMVYADACPNVVVEAMTTGLPAVVNHVSGAAEFALKAFVDGPWHVEPFHFKDTPKLNVMVLAEYMNHYKDLPRTFAVDNRININLVAKQYKKFFEEIL